MFTTQQIHLLILLAAALVLFGLGAWAARLHGRWFELMELRAILDGVQARRKARQLARQSLTMEGVDPL